MFGDVNLLCSGSRTQTANFHTEIFPIPMLKLRKPVVILPSVFPKNYSKFLLAEQSVPLANRFPFIGLLAAKLRREQQQKWWMLYGNKIRDNDLSLMIDPFSMIQLERTGEKPTVVIGTWSLENNVQGVTAVQNIATSVEAMITKIFFMSCNLYSKLFAFFQNRLTQQHLKHI